MVDTSDDGVPNRRQCVVGSQKLDREAVPWAFLSWHSPIQPHLSPIMILGARPRQKGLVCIVAFPVDLLVLCAS